MKYILSFLVCLTSLSAAHAEQPVIDYLQMDEPARTLAIHGRGFGARGQITVDNNLRPFTFWSDTLLQCVMPDSGAGFAGEVVVLNDRQESARRVLSKIGVYVKYEADYTHSWGDPGQYESDTVRALCIFRVDVRKPGVLIEGCRKSTFDFSVREEDRWSGFSTYGDKVISGSMVVRLADSLPSTFSTSDCSIIVLSSDSVMVCTPYASYTATVEYSGNVPRGDSSVHVRNGSVCAQLKIDSAGKVISDQIWTDYFPWTYTTAWSDSSSKFPAGVGYPHQISVRRTSAWPNPSDKTLEIELTPDVAADAEVEILDILGRPLKLSVLARSGRSIELNTSELPTGEYFCSIRGKEGSQFTRFVIAR